MTIAELHKLFISCGRRLTTDSRKIEGGEIFLAIKGDNFDGNSFAVQALEKGAAYAVVDADSDIAKEVKKEPRNAEKISKRIIVFPDTVTALRQLATYNRENTLHNGRRIKMLALTGTNGKTTTKELIKAVLQTKYRITATEGNLNNNLGVPFTLLGIKPDTELAIVEMGASHPGDINELVDIAHPDFGLITNVGRAHLLGFGSFEGVKRTKGELYDYIMKAGGKCFVNADNPDLAGMVRERPALATLPYGATLQKASVLPCTPDEPFLRISIDGVTVHTNLVGAYNMDNVLAALAVGDEFGVDRQDAIRAIEAYVPSNNRSQLVRTGRNTLIVDAYNANPSSMSAALDNFAAMQTGPKVIMLGDMLELGEDSLKEHRAILNKALGLCPELTILVGGEFASAVKSGNAQGNKKVLCFPDSMSAAEHLSEIEPLEGCTILVKGSRGTRMENLLKEL